MQRVICSIVSAACWVVAGAAPAAAQTYYVDLRGGYNHAFDSDATAAGTGAEAVFDPGSFAATALGLQWIDGWRVEGELSWRRNAIDSLAGVTADGEAEAYTAAINVYYRLMHERSVTPYLGGGIGAARVALYDLPSGLATVDDFDVVLAWQAMAGVDFSLSKSVTLSVEYRYFVAEEADFTDSLGTAWPMEFSGSTALLGLRLGF